MEYMPGMQVIASDIQGKVLEAMESYDYELYTAADVERALSKDTCSIEDFKALLSPAAAPFLERMARKAELITKNHFGNTIYLPLCILPTTARTTVYTVASTATTI